jgi:ParB family chromosome partitioning protein
LRKGELNVTQAQHLRRVPNERTQIELARAAVEEGMSAAEISRLASFFAANPNLSLDDALHALQQGIDLTAGAPVVARPSSDGSLLKGAAVGTLPDDEHDADLWDEETPDADLDTPGIEEETVENQPKNKARVFRIRSLDQMLDETDRLFRAHAEGDLIRWVRKDQDAPMKVGLLLKQLEALSHALREIARQQNWVFEDG